MKDEILTPKELAAELKRSIAYVYAMQKAGFKTVGRRTTLNAALEWLAKNPSFTTTPKSYKKRKNK